MKKLLSVLIALILMLTLVPTVSAATAEAEAAAYSLYLLGLFKGTGTNPDGTPSFSLDEAPNRNAAVTMLVRLLGKEEEALQGKWDCPFTDVADWAKPYVGYAYAHKLTSGTSATTYSGDAPVTATQYLTFVLRALGYDSGSDFAWDKAWVLSDELGITSGQYTDSSNADFLRSDMVLVSRKALDISVKGTDTPLIKLIFSDVHSQQDKPESESNKPSADDKPTETKAAEILESTEIPAQTGAAKLTEARLKALSGKTVEEAAKVISTLADAYAWLAQEGYSIHGMTLNNQQRFIVNGTVSEYGKEMAWAELSCVLNTLLEGDYDEVGSLMFITKSTDPGWKYYYITYNYVKCDGVYYITDPQEYIFCSGMATIRLHTVVTTDLSNVIDVVDDIPENKHQVLTVATYPLYSEKIEIEYSDDPILSVIPIKVPGLNILFAADSDKLEEYKKAQEEAERLEMERWDRKAAALRVADYGMPDAIGNTTITYKEAKALVGKDGETIAKSVKTVGDVLQYMIASRFGYNSPDAYTPWYNGNGEYWGFSAPGDEQLKQNFGCCCGGYANAVSYLLRGDYEKVGTLRWVGGGNHTISWVYTDGKYYVFDFTQYCNGGNYNNRRATVTVLDRLEDFYDQMPETYSFFPKSEVVIMVAFEAGEAMYPSGWNDPPDFKGLTLPSEAEGKVTLIYQKDPAYGVFYKDIKIDIPGWND